MKHITAKQFYFILFLMVTFSILNISYYKLKYEKRKFKSWFTIPLENILKFEEKLRESKGNYIFHIETHLQEERDLNDPRQACTVESAALMNPHIDIYFIFVTNSSGVNLGWNEIVRRLNLYPNINFEFLNPLEFANGTEARNFLTKGEIYKSDYPLEHMADFLRILFLNKYGGQYLDLDVFSLVPLSKINLQNFACLQNDDYVTNSIMNFNTDCSGSAVTNKYLE